MLQYKSDFIIISPKKEIIMKICPTCKKTKNFEEFYSRKKNFRKITRHNTSVQCKECQKQYKKDKWHILSTEKDEYEKFKKQMINKNKLLDESHIRKSYSACRRRTQNDLNESMLKAVYRQYKIRGFSESLKLFKKITKQNCHYCGVKPSSKKLGIFDARVTYICRRGEYIYNGIDRQDNTKGYEKENMVPCCRICNKSKNNLTLEQWNEWLERIIEYRGNK